MSNPFAGLVRRLDMEQFARRRDAQHAHLAKLKRLPLRQKISGLYDYERATLRPAIEAATTGGRELSKEGFKLIRDRAARSGDPILAHMHMRVLPMVERVKAQAPYRNALRLEHHFAQRDTLTDTSTDSAVRAWARKRAGEAVAAVARHEDLQGQFAAALEFTTRWGIEPPPLPEEPADSDLLSALARMTCARWWTRKARRRLTLDVERRAIEAGRVHRRAGVYVSDRNLERGKDQDHRNGQLLLNLVAENELGEQFPLADLVEKSLANPHIRLCELMVRLKGMEAVADRLGYAGLFLTWTLPSRYHARLSGSGEENPTWTADKLTPRQGQLRLRELWAWARAALAKIKARYFGVRVAEPHHDGTPHWHLLMFVPTTHREAVTQLLRRYAMCEAPEEAGAELHRFKVEVIDKAKGGATHYVAKYISKMTTGAGLGQMKERGADGQHRDVGAAGASVNRARRWASVHGIRQFQAFGVPPIGIWRELRRMDGAAPDTLPNGMPVRADMWARLERARACADESDYAGHLQAMGGPALPREQQPLALLREYGAPNVYGDYLPKTAGVCFRLRIPLALRPGQRRRRYHVETAGRFVTRLHTWVLKPRSGAVAVAVEPDVTSQGAETGAPWTRTRTRTRVNNCNRAPEGIAADGLESARIVVPDFFHTSDQGQFLPPETPP